MTEPEIAFADLSDNAALAEALLKYTFAALLSERQEDLAFFDQRIEKGLVAKLEGTRRLGIRAYGLRRGDPSARAGEREIRIPGQWGIDLQSEHERYLTEKYAKKPVIVVNYPKVIKAFYMRVNDDGRTVAAMDVLAPGIGEIIGGGQREERLDVLDRSMAERAIDKEHFAPTLPSPASGGGLGRGRSAPLRHGAARRLRPRPGFRRGHPRLRHRPRQRARRHPLPAHPRQRAVLTHYRRQDCPKVVTNRRSCVA
jgi:aspartyl/asparaginyl-tRNA synthetase